MNTFTGGARIYWSPWTGAHIINGAILAKYLGIGGAGAYGFPTTDVLDISGITGAPAPRNLTSRVCASTLPPLAPSKSMAPS